MPFHLPPFTIYLFVALAMTWILFVTGIANLFTFRKPRALIAGDAALPFISILVPARDEEQVIERCVRSLLALNYANFEVIVLDDNSSDATYDILCHLRNQDGRLRVLAGASLPEGWCGKPFAIWQLAQASRGEYLLLTDADCVFAPDALLLALGGMAEHKADMVSLCPDYLALTFWERLIIPLLVLIPVAFLPMFMIRASKLPVFSAANGAFIFISRENYFEIDGHRAVRAQLAEDIKFAAHVKQSGLTEWYGDGSRVYNVRMYDSLAGIWQGFTRNLFPAFSNKLHILLPVLAYLCITFIFPPVIAIIGYLLRAPWWPLALAPYLLIAALRLAIMIILHRDTVDSALLNPLAWLIALTIGIGSVIKNRKTGAVWKGRVYVAGQEQK